VTLPVSRHRVGVGSVQRPDGSANDLDLEHRS
jgi:hypothetical protein